MLWQKLWRPLSNWWGSLTTAALMRGMHASVPTNGFLLPFLLGMWPELQPRSESSSRLPCARVTYSPTPALLHVYPCLVHGNNHASLSLTISKKTGCPAELPSLWVIHQQLASPSLSPRMSQKQGTLGSTATSSFQRDILCSEWSY